MVFGWLSDFLGKEGSCMNSRVSCWWIEMVREWVHNSQKDIAALCKYGSHTLTGAPDSFVHLLYPQLEQVNCQEQPDQHWQQHFKQTQVTLWIKCVEWCGSGYIEQYRVAYHYEVLIHFSINCIICYTQTPSHSLAPTCKIVSNHSGTHGHIHASTYYPGQKNNHPRDLRREERCSTCDIMLDQARSTQGKSRGQSQIGLALRWSRLIEHDITRGIAFFSPRISMMVLFFVQGSTSFVCYKRGCKVCKVKIPQTGNCQLY